MPTRTNGTCGTAGGEYLFAANRFVKDHPPHRHRQRRGRHYRHGQRAAALRAFTAAKLYLQKTVSSLVVAADSCGSNHEYVRAMVTLILSEDRQLLHDVLHGSVSLLVAAKQIKPLADLVAAYRTVAAVPKDLATFGTTVGTAEIWDRVISPAL